MKITFRLWLSIVIIIALCDNGNSQSDNVELQTHSDNDLLMTYIDSVQEYLYRDSEIAGFYMDKSEEILESNPSIPDSTLAYHVSNKIFFFHNEGKPLKAFETFADTRYEIYANSIPDKLQFTLRYLEGFTYMTLGDLESAQVQFYENILRGKDLNNLEAVTSNLYSLGQLFSEDGQYQAALDALQKMLTYQDQVIQRPSTWILAHIETAEAYSELGEHDEALEEVQKSIDMAKEHDVNILKSNAKVLKGKIHLDLNQIAEAEATYNELSGVSPSELDYVVSRDLQEFKAQLHEARMEYDQAIQTYEALIEDTDSTDIPELISFHSALHAINNDKNDYKKAYEHLTEHSRLSQIKFEDDRRQNTEYLRVKYDSEQKDMDNQLLGAELSKKKLETSLLYAIAASFVLFCVGLIILFLQSRRQRRTLETEVKKRTLSLQQSHDLLEQSNVELDEFNRILSHDLKEPIRNIVSYGQLITHDNITDAQTKVYSSIIKNSGVQLYNLIENVEHYQDVQKATTLIPHTTQINEVIDNAINQVKQKHGTDKKLTISQEPVPPLKTYPKELEQVFYHLLENSVLYNRNTIPAIQIKHEEQEEYHLIQIIDNGLGIPEDYHDYVFGMFKRLNKRGEHLGSGLGLSITKKILQKIGGKVDLIDNPNGTGTAVRVYIPKL